MQEAKNCANRHLIGQGKILYGDPGIPVNRGGDSGDESLCPPGLLNIQAALIINILTNFIVLIMWFIVDL